MSFTENVNKTISQTLGLREYKSDCCGIEIEAEGDRLPAGAITPDFSGKQDGSLRNGMEFVSGRINRRDVGQKVSALADALRGLGVELRPSYRCSTHIHENYTAKTFSDVLGAYVVWALIEPTIFRLIPAGRDGSLFCVSSYDSGDLPDFIERFCRNIEKNFIGGFQPRGKYASQNISRLGPSDSGPGLGTLEYRVFPFTVEGEQVQQWVDWLGNLKGTVDKAKDKTYLPLVRWAEQNPKEFITQIIGTCPYSHEEAGQLVDFGARQAYEIARIISSAYKWKPNTKGAKKELPPRAVAGVGIADEAARVVWDQLHLEPQEVAPAQPVAGFRRRPNAAARPAWA